MNINWNGLGKEWVEKFKAIGLNQEDAEQLVWKVSLISGNSFEETINSVFCVIETFEPHNKLEDWMDIFR